MKQNKQYYVGTNLLLPFSNLKFDRILFQDFTCSSMCLSEQCWTTYLGFNVIPLLIVVGLVLYIDIFECTYTVNKKTI